MDSWSKRNLLYVLVTNENIQKLDDDYDNDNGEKVWFLVIVQLGIHVEFLTSWGEAKKWWIHFSERGYIHRVDFLVSWESWGMRN